MVKQQRCPTCKGPVKPRSENESYPFCSERCRLLDLGNWLNESYRVPERFLEEEEVVQLPDDGEGEE